LGGLLGLEGRGAVDNGGGGRMAGEVAAEERITVVRLVT